MLFSKVSRYATSEAHRLHVFSTSKYSAQSKDDEIKAEQNSVAANDNNEFKKIKFIKIQIISKVKSTDLS